MVLIKQRTNRKVLKLCFQILFFCLFLWFSLSSIQSFYLGEVIYDLIINTDNENVFFPAITLCPNERSNPFMNLKLDQLNLQSRRTTLKCRLHCCQFVFWVEIKTLSSGLLYYFQNNWNIYEFK